MEFKATKEGEILKKFEKYKGVSAVFFDNEEWRESESYEEGYNQALKDSKANEMLEMLQWFVENFEGVFHEGTETDNKVKESKQLIKQTTEL